jgi:hypothetical protein
VSSRIVESFWAAMQDDDWEHAASHLTEKCVIDWPCSGETHRRQKQLRGCASGRARRRAARRGALKQMLTAANVGESSQRSASRIADAVRSFAPAPLQDDMAIVVVQVTPAAAAEVAA